ncbi:MAG TPA: aldose 1-epimerase [Rhizomicrobium sp.]|nr:aldose 1-epimerase [Rhizomicrobium sp.]
MITLRSGGAELDLLPKIGGAVSRFAVDGSDVLRPAPPGTTDVLQTACFALVPFANRIAHGAFAFRGEAVRLKRNFGDHPHALHGQGWQNEWSVRAQTRDSAVLAFAHGADAWPWDYAAEQAFVLTPDSLRLELTLSNRSARAMPASLGFHPYFPRTERSRLQAEIAGVWLSDATAIPTVKAQASHFLDLAGGAALGAAPFVDHCHFGWKGAARIAQPENGRRLLLGASPELGFLHVFVPPNADFFCVEPVSAMPDAFNRAADESGLRVIAAGDSFRVAMTLSVQPADRRC